MHEASKIGNVKRKMLPMDIFVQGTTGSEHFHIQMLCKQWKKVSKNSIFGQNLKRESSEWFKCKIYLKRIVAILKMKAKAELFQYQSYWSLPIGLEVLYTDTNCALVRFLASLVIFLYSLN